MPTYDYVCDACEHSFEEFQMMSAKPLRKCPDCGKAKLRRLIGTGAGVIFKGGGFYETDYRSESYQKDAKADQPGEAKKDGGEKKADAKKSEAKTSEGSAKTETKKAETKPAPKPGKD
jgi:putative FmdB family regulatory protein